MPVYLPKNANNSIPSATQAEFGADDPDDFIADPDQFRDLLPQPFRLIDKIVKNLIEDAIDLALLRESKRIRETTKFRPPQYFSDVNIQVQS
jgi:hypothetical protein